MRQLRAVVALAFVAVVFLHATACTLWPDPTEGGCHADSECGPGLTCMQQSSSDYRRVCMDRRGYGYVPPTPTAPAEPGPVANAGVVTVLARHSLGSPAQLAVGASHVYWSVPGTRERGFEDGAIVRAPIDGGGVAQTIASNQPSIGTVAVDATTVYWTTGTTRTLWKAALDGTGVSALAVSDRYFTAVHRMFPDAASGFLYLATDYADPVVARIALGGGVVEPLAVLDAHALVDIVFDGAHLTWATSKSTLTATNGEISTRSIASDNSSPTTIVTGEPKVKKVAVDGTNVYGSTPSGIFRVSTSGGTKSTILAESLGAGGDFVVDGAYVYYASPTGLGKAAKTGGPGVVHAAFAGTVTAVAVGEHAILVATEGDEDRILAISK